MDLYGINPALRKGLSGRSHFSRPNSTPSGNHNEITKQFASNDILSSSAWSSVIHQPAQDSEPEDLPSTVDIDAIKEPTTPINASAQTPVGQLHGDGNSFELSDDQNVGDSGSDSDSDSESGNSENEPENADSGGDSGSCSDSDSASSHRSSSSSKGKAASSPSSRSNTPPSNSEDNQQQFSVQETNFDQGGLKLRLSALKVSNLESGTQSDYLAGRNAEDSSDSSEPKFPYARKKPKCEPLIHSRKMYSLKLKDDYKNRGTVSNYRYKDRGEYDTSMYDRDSDSESSSSSNTSPVKSYLSGKFKEHALVKIDPRFNTSPSKSKSVMSDLKNYGVTREDKVDKRRIDAAKNIQKDRPPVGPSKYRKPVFSLPSLKLPQACKLSEDSDDSTDTPKVKFESETKKENSRDTIEKLARQLTQPGNSSEHLQVLNEEDLAAVLPDVESPANREFELADSGSGKKKSKVTSECKRAPESLSDSSSDAGMLPKQIASAINSIHVDSDASDESDDSSVKNKSSEDSSSSSDEDVRNRRKDKGQYSSNLLEAFVEKTVQLNKSDGDKKSSSSKPLKSATVVDKPLVQKKAGPVETVRKRGRPPKSKISSMAEIEAYMRLDCTISNVSPDSGIQSNSGSPLYHGLPSPAIYNSALPLSGSNNKLNAGPPNSKVLSLGQKALLSACKKNSYPVHDLKERKPNSIQKTLKVNTTQPKNTSESLTKRIPNLPTDAMSSSKTCKSSSVSSKNIDDMLKVPPYLGPKLSPTVINSSSSSARSNLTLFQEKRGPGRPKKSAPAKLNGQTSVEKLYSDKIDNPFDKSLPFSSKAVIMSNGQPKKPKYTSSVISCLESPKKRAKKKNLIGHPTLINRCLTPNFTPLFPPRKEWSHKHKKRKKKDSKEKVVNPELLKEVDRLVEVFSKKCVIEDKKSLADVNSQFLHSVVLRAKGTHRMKDRSKKRKHSDKDSESESNSTVSVLATDVKTKRRHKKSAIETPKVLATNSDQRLPLKKRHYHISASSTINNSHQTHADVKTRIEKHSATSVNELSASVTPIAVDASSKSILKTSAVDVSSKSIVKTAAAVKSFDNQKPKPEVQKNVSKSETTKGHKVDSPTPLPKIEMPKHTAKVDQPKSVMLKAESTRTSSKSETAKTSSVKPDIKSMPPTLSSSKKERCRKSTKDSDIDTPPVLDEFGLSSSKRSDGASFTGEVGVTHSAVVAAQMSSPSKQPQLITPLPSEPTSRSASPSLKPPAGVFEPTRKMTTSLTKSKKRSINDVLSKLNENLKVLETPKENSSPLIEKIGATVTTPGAAPPSERVLRSKRASTEKENINAKKKRMCTDVTICLPKLQSCEIPDGLMKEEDGDVAKPKIKRRKNRNPTGFPIKKKKKMKKDLGVPTLTAVREVPELPQLQPEGDIVDNSKSKGDGGDSNRCPVIVKQEVTAAEDNADDNIPLARRMPPVLSAVKVKNEVANEEEAKTEKQPLKPVMKTNSKLSGSLYPSQVLPSRYSARINVKKQLRAREVKKMKGKEKVVPVNKNRVTRSRESTKEEATKLKKDVENKRYETREMRSKSNVEQKVEKIEKEDKPKEETDNDELRIPTLSAGSEVMELPQLEPEGDIVDKPKSEEDDGDSDRCPIIVKQQVTTGEDNADDEIPLERRAPPVLSAVRVKNETAKKVHAKTERQPLKPKMKTNSKLSGSLYPSRVLPSRYSARINVKKQLRAREVKKMKGKEKKVIPANKNRVTHSRQLSKEEAAKPKKDVENRRYETRETRSKSNVEQKVEVKGDKEDKPKEETDKDELSDDSVKCTIPKKDAAPKKRRKFISAGLFSDYYKEDRNAAPDLKNRFAPYKPEDHPHGLLPPPPYFEDWVRRRQVDFKLPYDLWWLHTHDQLPGRDVVESWKYKRIRMNVYYDVKPTNVYEAQACNCVLPADKNKLGCGDDCINRVVFAECSPDLCPLKDRCSNQRIQKHDGDLKLSKFMTADKGIGVKTERPIKAGEYILEYVGEVVTDKEFKKRMTSLYKNDIHHYCLNLNGGLVIDGHRMGSDGRFVNHSCEPNCEIQKWNVNGLFRMALFAQRDIEAGEELTYDYNFALFNPEEGQPCRCGSSQCRGVIGGKSQRVSIGNGNNTTVTDSSSNNASNTTTGNASNKKARLRPRKHVRKNNYGANGANDSTQRRRDSEGSSNSIGVLPHRNVHHYIPVTPLSAEEKKIVQHWHVLLPRNLTKIQKVREKIKQLYDNKENSNSLNQNTKCVKSKQSVEFLMQLNALSQERFIKTRGLAQVEDNPEMTKTLQLANCFRTIYNAVITAKDETSGKTFSSLFMALPSKRKLPMYYQRIEDPIDLSTIEKNIITGVYKDVEGFDKDMNKLIMNNVKYYGRTSDYGIAAVRLRKEYNIAKLKHTSQLEEIIGHPLPSSFIPVQEDPGDEDEDVIRCICGLYNDEGLMIQCERCLVWQHCGCVSADSAVEHYHCERCSGREVDYEIPLDVEPPERPAPEEKHFLTLMRDDLQIRQGDTVYVLRDIPNRETGSRHTFRTIKTFKYEDCDIYRVEQLWKTENGEKFAFGHHYLRPHETFHEPTRKFFPNEVLKILLYETVPLDLIMGRCYVLDLGTYCKGRPIDSDPEHIYICEYRVDKSAKSFHKLKKSKQQCSVSTKNYAFERYDTILKPSRTYAPHGDARPTTSSHIAVTSKVTKAATSQKEKARPSKVKEIKESTESSRVTDAPVESSPANVKIDEDDVPLARIKDTKFEQQKQRLNNLLLKLLAKKSTKTPLDASYLLDTGRRNRKKPPQATSSSTNV